GCTSKPVENLRQSIDVQVSFRPVRMNPNHLVGGWARVKLIRGKQMEKLTGLLTIGEVAEILRVHPTTIYRLVKRGVLPGFKIGGNWRIDKGSFDLFLSEASPPHLTQRV